MAHKHRFFASGKKSIKLDYAGESFFFRHESYGSSCDSLGSVKTNFQDKQAELNLGEKNLQTIVSRLESWSLKDEITNEPIPVNRETIRDLCGDIAAELLIKLREIDVEENKKLGN